MTPERPGVTGDGRRDHRVEAGALVELGRLRGRRELVGEVVTGEDDPILGDGGARRADPDRDPELRALLRGEQLAQTRSS